LKGQDSPSTEAEVIENMEETAVDPESTIEAEGMSALKSVD
jgi:hypothetical protein